MKGRIFTAYHFIPEPPSVCRFDDLYQPVLMNHEVGNRPDLLSILHGDAPGYKPLTTAAGFDEIGVKWYVWKNLLSKYDWFGFQQYRRPLDFGGRSNDEIRALVEQYDIITNQPDETTDENPNIRESVQAPLQGSAVPVGRFREVDGRRLEFHDTAQSPAQHLDHARRCVQ